MQGAKAVLSFVALYGDLVVDDLDNNTITVTDPGNTISGNLYGIYTVVNNSNTPSITFTNSIQNNNVTLSSIIANMTTYGFYFHDLSGAHTSANINISDSLDTNTILIDNRYQAFAFYNDANLEITNDIVDNQWTVQDSNMSVAGTTENFGFYNSGILELDNFNGNTIIVQDHSGPATAFETDGSSAELTINGNFGELNDGNTLKALDPTNSSNTTAIPVIINSTTNISGDFNYNTLLSETDLATSARTRALYFETNGIFTLGGDMSHNRFEVNATAGNRINVFSMSDSNSSQTSVLINGNFNDNDLIADSAKGGVTGMETRKGPMRILGNVNNNTFDLHCGGAFFGPAGVSAIVAYRVIPGSFGSSVSNTVDGNTFTLTGVGGMRAFRIQDSSFSFYNIQNNDFSSIPTSSTVMNFFGSRTINIYGASNATNLASQNTGLSASEITDTSANYIP
jgi:hypothetical protein